MAYREWRLEGNSTVADVISPKDWDAENFHAMEKVLVCFLAMVALCLGSCVGSVYYFYVKPYLTTWRHVGDRNKTNMNLHQEGQSRQPLVASIGRDSNDDEMNNENNHLDSGNMSLGEQQQDTETRAAISTARIV